VNRTSHEASHYAVFSRFLFCAMFITGPTLQAHSSKDERCISFFYVLFVKCMKWTH